MKITKNSLKQLIKEVLAEEEEVGRQGPQEPKMTTNKLMDLVRRLVGGKAAQKIGQILSGERTAKGAQRSPLNQAWQEMRRLGIKNVQENPTDKRVQAWVSKGSKKGKEWTTLKYNHPARQKVRDLGKARKQAGAKPAAPEPQGIEKMGLPKKPAEERGGEGQAVTLPSQDRKAAFQQIDRAKSPAEYDAAVARLRKIPGGEKAFKTAGGEAMRPRWLTPAGGGDLPKFRAQTYGAERHKGKAGFESEFAGVVPSWIKTLFKLEKEDPEEARKRLGQMSKKQRKAVERYRKSEAL
jgi:hypothetical protein